MRWATCPLAEAGAELLFQVIADRAEKAAVIITNTLPFSNGRRASQHPPLQGTAGPHHRPRSHPRDRNRVVPLPSHHGTKEENLTKVGQISPSFYFSSATLRRTKTTTLIHSKVGPLFTDRVGPSFVDRSKRRSSHRLATVRRPSTRDESSRRGWLWCRSSTQPEARRSCMGSASAAIATSARFWFMGLVLSCCDRREIGSRWAIVDIHSR